MVLFQLEVRTDYIYAMEAGEIFMYLMVTLCTAVHFYLRKCSSNLQAIAWGGKFEHCFVTAK
jgi:hypothetical protein